MLIKCLLNPVFFQAPVKEHVVSPPEEEAAPESEAAPEAEPEVVAEPEEAVQEPEAESEVIAEPEEAVQEPEVALEEPAAPVEPEAPAKAAPEPEAEAPQEATPELEVPVARVGTLSDESTQASSDETAAIKSEVRNLKLSYNQWRVLLVNNPGGSVPNL